VLELLGVQVFSLERDAVRLDGHVCLNPLVVPFDLHAPLELVFEELVQFVAFRLLLVLSVLVHLLVFNVDYLCQVTGPQEMGQHSISPNRVQ